MEDKKWDTELLTTLLCDADPTQNLLGLSLCLQIGILPEVLVHIVVYAVGAHQPVVQQKALAVCKKHLSANDFKVVEQMCRRATANNPYCNFEPAAAAFLDPAAFSECYFSKYPKRIPIWTLPFLRADSLQQWLELKFHAGTITLIHNEGVKLMQNPYLYTQRQITTIECIEIKKQHLNPRLFELPNVYRFIAEKAAWHCLPQEICQWQKMKELLLTQLQLTDVKLLQTNQWLQLTKLDLSHNLIHTLELNCPKLEILVLDDNLLTSLPDSLASCLLLRKLSLNSLRIRKLPLWLVQLDTLEIIELNNTELTDIEILSGLPKIKAIHIMGCAGIKALPESFIQHPTLEIIESDNPKLCYSKKVSRH
jgi:hypothetical protein